MGQVAVALETKVAPAGSVSDLPWDLLAPPRVPVARPRLVPMAGVLPYLISLDDSRTYSNFGPLNQRFEARLAERFGLTPDCVVTCASATAGLTMALQRAAAGRGGYCLMPAWTFAATAHAAISAGLTPWLLDVEIDTGLLTPGIVEDAIRRVPGRVAAVVPVAAYGLPVDTVAWDAFQTSTGIDVIIDAAAGFDRHVAGDALAVVSLHATKVFGIGEGGFLISRDPAAIADIRRRSNFGFDNSREAALHGGNGKLSEIGAAVGLAGLDFWPVQRLSYLSVLHYYRTALAGVPQLKFAEGLGETWVSATCNIEAPAPLAQEIERRLGQVGIATRRWWGRGLHTHPAFDTSPRLDLSVTDGLAARTLGLPCYPDVAEPDLAQVSAIVRDVLRA